MNVSQQTLEENIDDEWDPMREEYEDLQMNSYDYGPGANLDSELQRPAYRNAKDQVVYKIMVSRIPPGLEQVGLENLFLNFGSPKISKCKQNNGQMLWALIEFKTLHEAQKALVLDSAPPYNLKVGFARSDEENERLRKEREANEKYFALLNAKSSENIISLPQKQDSPTPNRNLLKMLGRGQNRGRLLVRAYRDNCERRAGSRTCVWSAGEPDVIDPGNRIYNPKSYRYEGSNRILQNIVIQASSSSARKIEMGRGYITPSNQEGCTSSQLSATKSIGDDICVPMLPCSNCRKETTTKCGNCGVPYCSVQCQRNDFVRHRRSCHSKASIDVMGSDPQQSTRVAPLFSKKDTMGSTGSMSMFQSSMFWGKPENSVIRLLTVGSKGIIAFETGLDGCLSCDEAFPVTQQLMGMSKYVSPYSNAAFGPPVGTMVAVRWENSIWRGYVLNAPIAGSAELFTIALCDRGLVIKAEAHDVLQLPSNFVNLPELAVSCKLENLSPELKSTLERNKEVTIFVESCSVSQVSAKVMCPDNEQNVIGVVVISPWQPSHATELVPVLLTPPCPVIISSYHHQHALYVRPMGKNFQEQFFTLLQQVAAIHVTSPPLGRPPYKGEMVVCRFSKDQNFYRAIICGESATTPQEYSVFFVDFGNLESASLNDLKALPDNLKKYPCMAVKISLKGVQNGPLTETAVQYLNMQVLKEQQFQLECSPGSKDGVELVLPNKKTLNSELNELLMPDWKFAKNRGEDPHNGEVFLYDQLKCVPLKSGTTNIFVWSILMDGRLAVSPVDRPEVEHVHQTLFFQINEYCESTDQNDKYNPRQDEICLAKFKEDGMWYRAVNMQTFTTKCRVLFLDFGNVEEVEFKDVRRMVPDFMTTRSLMSMCTVVGLPIEPENHMVDRLRALVPTPKVYDVKVIEVISEGEYKVFIPEVSNQLQSEFGP